MCRYCWGCGDGSSSMSSSDVLLLPLVTRVRRLYRKVCRRGGCAATPDQGTCEAECVDSDASPAPSSQVVLPSSCQGDAGRAPFLLQKDGVRVLLFRECDRRGRKLLYDSKTVVQVPLAETTSNASSQTCKTLFKGSWGAVGSGGGAPGAPPSQSASRISANSVLKSSAPHTCSKPEVFAEINGRYGYQYHQKEGDTKMLGELVFGTVDLAYKGSCSKLHLLHNPHRVLLSRSSPAPHSHLPRGVAGSDQGIEDTSFSSSISSLSEAVSRTDSLEVPWGPTMAWEVPHMLSTSNSEGDSGFGGPPSPYSSTCGSFLSPHSLPATPHGTPSSRQGSGNSLKNSGSLNSLQRRFLRTVNNSLEALGEAQGGSSSPPQPSRHATKLGLAVILQLQADTSPLLQKKVEDWLFLHLGVIESSVNKLQSSLDAAYLHRQTFVSTTHQAVGKLQQDLVDLVGGARLSGPMWLGLLGRPGLGQHQALCASFVDTLATVLTAYDTKHTNFFVSKLLTAVLTHHLGWVSTVAPSEPPLGPPHLPLPPFTPTQPLWVEQLNESHPYSAVWAQLCELSGAVGYPPRAARTILLGSNTSLLAHLLTILSYIIRCSQVVEHDIQSHQPEDSTLPPPPPHPAGQQQQQPGASSTTSSVTSIVTLVEGGPRDSSRDLQQPARTLQRDSSIRRSWRAAREGRSSGLLARTDSRGGGGMGESSLEMVRTGEEGQRTTAGDGDAAARWMLNDGEEIVIRGVGGGRLQDTSQEAGEGQKNQAEGGPRFLEAGQRTLSSCKTSTDLASMAGGGEELELRPQGGRLYPALHHLDDHRETFGPVELEPDRIAQKVQRLFRGSPRPEGVEPGTPAPEEATSHAGSQCQSDQLWPAASHRQAGGESESIGFLVQQVIVPAEDIQPEVEEGGKVLVLGGDTAHPTCPTRTHSASPATIGFEGVVGTSVTCLPSPVDTRRVVRTRNVGRVSARDLTKLEEERAIYPTLSDLREDVGSCRGRGGLVRADPKGHRRHHSDPTNGLFITRPNPIPGPLKGLAEEQVTEHKELTPGTPEVSGARVEGLVSPGVVPVPKDQGATEDQESDSGATENQEGGGGPAEEPLHIQMPRCVCEDGGRTRNVGVGVAGSLLGGVLDHYSSVFVLHATTQTHHWEDALRQDLAAATLDQQVAEAVAVVADTDSWEVQAVSPHSYVVEQRGGGAGLVGVRVGMSPLVSAITDSLLDLTRLNVSPLFIVQHLEERLSELYLKSQLLAEYLLGGGSREGATHHLPNLTRALGLDLNDLPLLLAVASTHTPALTHMFGLSFK